MSEVVEERVSCQLLRSGLRLNTSTSYESVTWKKSMFCKEMIFDDSPSSLCYFVVPLKFAQFG